MFVPGYMLPLFFYFLFTHSLIWFRSNHFVTPSAGSVPLYGADDPRQVQPSAFFLSVLELSIESICFCLSVLSVRHDIPRPVSVTMPYVLPISLKKILISSLCKDLTLTFVAHCEIAYTSACKKCGY